jgi:hypothetical protein
LQIKKRSNQGRTPKKDIHEELEYTKGVIRAVPRRRTHKKSLKIHNGVIRGCTPKKDMQEEFENTKEITRRRISKKDRYD